MWRKIIGERFLRDLMILISGSGLVYLFVQGRVFFLFGFAASDFFQAGEIFCSCRSSSAEYSSSRGEGDSSGFFSCRQRDSFCFWFLSSEFPSNERIGDMYT